MSTERAPETWFFLRGLVREAGHWAGFLERFRAAFPGREAVALDLPGNGAHFREPSPLSVARMAESVRAEYLARRGPANHLFALSLGGMVGLEWLRRWPGDFRSTVLVNTSVRGLSPFHQRLRPRNYARILTLMFSGDPAAVERKILEMTSHNLDRREELVRAWTEIHRLRPVSPRNAVRQLWAASRFRPPRERPPVPTLVLNGARDELVNPACSKALAGHWGLELRVHPEAGHDLTLDAPDWVLEQLRTWPRD